MRPNARKQAAHVARVQRKAAKRRKLHKSGKTGNSMERGQLLVPIRAQKQKPPGLPKLVKQARNRMIERARILAFPGFVRQKAAGE